MTPRITVTWITLLFLFFLQCKASKAISSTELDSLTSLYYSTNGPEWQDNLNWLKGDPCTLRWYGVSCVGGHVAALNLINNHLVGTLPSNIGGLTYLKQLSIDVNQISGSIPSSISEISDLVTFSFQENELTGCIPSLQGLGSLKYWRGAHNNLTCITDNFDGVTSLDTWDVSYNSIETPLPETMTSSAYIRRVYFSHNKIKSSIPEAYSIWNSMLELSLEDNFIFGTIPQFVCTLFEVNNITLSHNHLSGSIPSCLVTSTNVIRTLALDHNVLNGTFPDINDRMVDALSSLRTLLINSNFLAGALPAQLGSLPLETLRVDDNLFTGNFPFESTNIPNFNATQNRWFCPLPDFCSYLGDGMCAPCFFPAPCCITHNSSFCAIDSISDCVCDQVPYCCNVQQNVWDETCVAAVEKYGCGNCSAGPLATGCYPHDGPGCNDKSLSALVCEKIPTCCAENGNWTTRCAEASVFLSANEGGGECGLVSVGDCGTVHSTPGCSNFEITNCVCNLNSFCCSGSWDAECVKYVTNEICSETDDQMTE